MTRSGPELERILETAEILQYEDFAQAIPPEVKQRLGLQVTRGEGLFGLTTPGHDHPMFNRVMGVGLDPSALAGGPERLLDRFADHYRKAGIRRWMLQLLPHVEHAGFGGEAAKRGMVRHRGWAKHLGSPGASTSLAREASGVEVVRLAPDGTSGTRSEAWLADAWAEICARMFGLPEPFVTWLRALHGRTGWHLYLALHGGTPVATGALFLCESALGRMGQLTFAGTVPDHRRMGAQSALIAHRIRDAAAWGARWIVSETDEELPDRPNPSTRNLIRMGFPVTYVRANWGPPKPT